MVSLERLINPRSIAVVGATDREGTYAHTTLLNLQRAGFTGRVVGIHPTRSTAAGVPCVPSLAEAGSVDAVVIATPADTVSDYLAEAAALGCGGAVVYAAGFAEAGRRDLQEDLVNAAGALPVIGPNGNGIVSVAARAPMWGDAVTLPRAVGGVALITESGNIGVIGLAHRGAEGLHTVISSGNAAVIDTPTLLAHTASITGVRAVALYVEGDGDGARWCDALAECVERDVRVVVLKVGRSERGAAVGAAHTAALVGDQQVFAAMIQEAGGVLVRQPLELFETARALAMGHRDRRGAAFVTCSGGDAAIAADLADDFGVRLADLAPSTRDTLRDLLPPAATVANPLDHTALVWADTEAVAALTQAVARDDDVGHLVYIQDEPPGLPPGPLAEWRATREGGVVGGQREGIDTMVVATTPGQGAAGVIEGLDNALRAIAVLQAAPPRPERLRAMAHTAATSGRPRDRDESEAKDMLRRHGVVIPPGRVVEDSSMAVSVAEEIGFPVALKIVAPGILHKSDMGGVVLGLTSGADVAHVAERLLALVPGARILVEQMAPPGVEVIVAARRDGVVPTLTIGLGGIWTEALADVVCLPLPADADRIRLGIQQLRGHVVLTGGRGTQERDLDGLCMLAAKVGDALLAEELTLVEVNPVIVGFAQSFAVDVVMV